MSEEQLVRHCAPTMAGLKTGNLFSTHLPEGSANLHRTLSALNKRFCHRGIRIIPIGVRNGKALIYMYRPERLDLDLASEGARAILRRHGYPVESSRKCIARLMKRFGQSEEFPHEIGLFLGYPPEDVEGFIVHSARCAKCVGTWKVYGNECEAKRKFAQYAKCSRLFQERYAQSQSIDRLIVSC